MHITLTPKDTCFIQDLALANGTTNDVVCREMIDLFRLTIRNAECGYRMAFVIPETSDVVSTVESRLLKFIEAKAQADNFRNRMQSWWWRLCHRYGWT